MGANFGDVDNDGYLDIIWAWLALIYLLAAACAAAQRWGQIVCRHHRVFGHRRAAQRSRHRLCRLDQARQRRHRGGDRRSGPADKHIMRVFENPGNRNNWLNVRLIGVKSNREALGAQIHVAVQDGDSPPRSIYRTVGQTSSFGGNPVEQNIGLGPDAHDVTLDILWPASGTRQHFTGVAMDQYIEIKEFAPSYTRLQRHPFRLGKSGSPVTASTVPKAN